MKQFLTWKGLLVWLGLAVVAFGVALLDHSHLAEVPGSAALNLEKRTAIWERSWVRCWQISAQLIEIVVYT